METTYFQGYMDGLEAKRELRKKREQLQRPREVEMRRYIRVDRGLWNKAIHEIEEENMSPRISLTISWLWRNGKRLANLLRREKQ
jgi:hypothetical protein